MATLFSYFKKAGNNPKKNTNCNDAHLQKNGKEEVMPRLEIVEGTPNANDIDFNSPVVETNVQLKPSYTCGDIVWAKLDEYPWWPAMVCEHPRTKQFYMMNNGEVERVHVQFFGEPPSRDWVHEKNVELFGKREGSTDKDVVYACEMATRASKLEVNKRLEVYYACKLSDEENSSEEETNIKKRVIKRPRETKSNGKRKRKRLKILDSDDEDSGSECSSGGSTYEPERSDTEEDYESDKSDTDSGNVASEEDEVGTSGKRKRPIPKQKGSASKKKVLSNITNTRTPVTPLSSKKLNTSLSRAQASLSKFSPAGISASRVTNNVENGQDFTHYGLKFLKDGQRKDKFMKLHTDPDYDPRTLHVPQSYIDSKEVTPGMKQWWTLKRDLYDTIIFFKVGKFYELYHMDAVIGVKELGLLYMKGNFAHCGFPEIGFSRYSEGLIQKGYKVARVEQTETPQQLAARSGGKVVRREVCALISKGTRTFSFMEGESDESTATYLLAFMERPSNEVCLGGSEFGVCFVDTSIGKFHIGQFSDDRQASRFLTMISQYPPAQLLYERNKVSPKVQHLLQHELLPTLKDALSPGSEFWTASKTMKYLQENNYFYDEDKSNSMECPSVLKQMLADEDSLGIEPSEKYQYAISALGACTWYLKKCCIHQELLSMSQFEMYIPSDNIVTEKRSDSNILPQHMILDGVTLSNLDIVINNEGTTDGTLLQLLDNCTTPFGKRYFKQWLCMPSCNKHAIKSRLDAVEDLMKLSAAVTNMQAKMKTLPDLERILRRIHTLGSLKRSNDHPDSRAIFYNDETYSKKKIADLVCAIEGFQRSTLIINALQEHISSLSSPMLKSLLHEDTEMNLKGQFPNLTPTLNFFTSAFDHKKAKETGTIHPKPGVLAQYDKSIEQLKSIEEELDSYLKQQRKRLGCSTIKYWGTGRNRHQLEVPESAIMKSTPNDYHLASQKKGFKRFVSDTTNTLNERLNDAEELRDGALKDTLRSIFFKFDKHRELWEKAVRCLATLDCLMCLAQYSSNLDGVSCRPEIIDPVDAGGKEIQPFFELLNCLHPCARGGDFIPNDIVLGKGVNGENAENGRYPSCVLVTGPNMGGKSTLMRQAGVILIMAQLGCYVPAEVCRFTPVDRIFTRLGARDRILHGESTFFVELSETSTIFQHATKHSLVLLDELGRGTATYDGTSIASAVVHDLATRIRCRTLFSTHYHTLVDDFSNVKDIKLGHMACMVEKDDEENDDPSEETITFLYKFSSGACPKSYGFNAAKLAGLPLSVIKKGYRKAVEFEDTSRNIRMCRKLMNSPVDQVKDIVSLIG